MVETCRPWRFFYARKWKVHVSNIQFKPDYFFRWYIILRAAVHRIAKLLLHMYFSLDQLVTKNQKLNTKCLPNFFAVVSIWKEDSLAWPLFFLHRNKKKNFGQHLVLRIWFLATGRSNEKNINLEEGLRIKLCDEETPATLWTKTCKKVLKPNIKGKSILTIICPSPNWDFQKVLNFQTFLHKDLKNFRWKIGPTLLFLDA